jgi:putative inorganic carbon (hco3(-)) transporter
MARGPQIPGARAWSRVKVTFTAILLYVALVYLRPHEFVVALQELPILPVLLGFAFLAWLPSRKPPVGAPQLWLMPVLVGWMALTVLLNGWAGKAVYTLVQQLPLVILFILVSTSTTTIARHEAFLRVVALATTILALHGVGQVAAGIGWSGASVSQGSRITYIGTFNDPNDLALAFVIALPMQAYLLGRAGFVGRLFWLACIALTAYGIFLTNSRGGMLAALALLLMAFLSRFGAVMAAVAGSAAVGALAMLPTRMGTLSAGESSAAGRVESWYYGLQMFFTRPIIGIGKGNYGDYHELTAHNSLVLVFAELGIVGYFLWLSFVGMSIYMVWRIVRAKAVPAPMPGPTPAAAPVPARLAVPVTTPAKDDADWKRFQKIARTYLLAMGGFAICAFFLSRSYNILLIILCALCVGAYLGVRTRWPRFEPITLSTVAVPVAGFELASIAFMYLLVKAII